MFKRHPQHLQDLVKAFMRNNGLETPYLQRQLIASWPDVAGAVYAQNTEDLQIRNQTLWVKIMNPAVRADLQMNRTNLVALLNAQVGAQIITDIRVY